MCLFKGYLNRHILLFPFLFETRIVNVYEFAFINGNMLKMNGEISKHVPHVQKARKT